MDDKSKNNELLDGSVIKELMETWAKNEKARKANEFRLIQETVNEMMLPQVQKIIDNQNQAWEKCERNIKKIRKKHEKWIKKMGEKGE